MVELCELNLIDQGLECQWPPDIDQHIAELEFERSLDGDGSSLFSSMTVDPSIISTDSLDIEKLHAQCEVNKNDYKLTFEDSGQWASGNFTTWGRIRSTEPLDDKTSSLPELGASPRKISSAAEKRPSSLLATFVDRQTDYEYAELYMGNGRYVDVNDNEIGFVPQSTAAMQSADRWRFFSRIPEHVPMKSSRTFADLEARAPPLDFMAMEHQTPNLCRSSTSLSDIMLKAKEGFADEEKLEMSVLNALGKQGPDSGLGSSVSATSGPAHIEDWSSLAVLLPKHVVEACSFFKANSQLLFGSQQSNNIERLTPRKNVACRTCFGVRRRLHPPMWAHPASVQHVLCDCASSEVLERSYRSVRDQNCASARLMLRAQELSIVGLPIYDSKRMLVERVVEGVAEVVRGNDSSSLCVALEALVSDGLKDKHPWDMIVAFTSPGPATKSVYSLVCELNNGRKKPDSRVSLFFGELVRMGAVDCWIAYVVLKETFLQKFYIDSAFLLRACTAYRSLLFRLIENLEVLSVLEEGFQLRRYRMTRTASHLQQPSRLHSDSRVPKSSSVPARLSAQRRTVSCVPCSNLLRRSRIPQLADRPKHISSGVPATFIRNCYASAIDDCDKPGMLAVTQGELLRVLRTRGTLAHCCRTRPRHDRVSLGLVPLSNLTKK
uniref:RUN domain-containing protein n=1 Tax=Syphacia muris TaxID=451379 RepID=A0A158R4L3_9BILA